MATRTVADLLNRVRVVLQDQDQDGYRYPTADLVGYLNDSVLEAKRLRPDLFVGRYRVDPPQVSDILTDYTVVKFPLPDSCFAACVAYVAGNAEMRDDEFAVDNRASSFVASFTQKMMGGG